MNLKEYTVNIKKVGWKYIMKINSVFFSYFRENKKTFLRLIIVFFIGIILGIVFINNANQNQINEINDYINTLIENIKNAENINKTPILKQSLKQNILFIILIWGMGCTLLGNVFIYIVILYKGFSMGYTVSSIIATLGTKSRNDFRFKFNVITKFNFFACNIFFI